MTEIWKGIPNYDYYQVSNLGNVKSLERTIIRSNGIKQYIKERLLKQTVTSTGYLSIGLYEKRIHKTRKVHQLVAESFLGHKPNGMNMVINHINFNKLDNRVENLNIITQRENTNQKHLESSSNYIGVCWDKHSNKWKSSITINGVLKHLGNFDNELEASNEYKLTLKNITR